MQTANRANHIMFIILAWGNSNAIPNNNTNREISEEGVFLAEPQNEKYQKFNSGDTPRNAIHATSTAPRPGI
jgi:hypothetical protein